MGHSEEFSMADCAGFLRVYVPHSYDSDSYGDSVSWTKAPIHFRQLERWSELLPQSFGAWFFHLEIITIPKRYFWGGKICPPYRHSPDIQPMIKGDEFSGAFGKCVLSSRNSYKKKSFLPSGALSKAQMCCPKLLYLIHIILIRKGHPKPWWKVKMIQER